MKEYVNRLKNNLKVFFEEEKLKFIEYDNKIDESIEKGKFDDEGGVVLNNNLCIVIEEDLKKNKNVLFDKE